MFKGKLYHCEGDELHDVHNKSDCQARNYTWINSAYNYDNLIDSLFTLFILSTKDGWVDEMYKGIDAVGVDMQPQKNHNEYMALFFIIYLLVVGFFVVNMFVGVIIDNYHKCHEEQLKEQVQKRNEKKQMQYAETESKLYFEF